jgi:DNA-directed RNA polymerase specialized sigma subunit
MNINIKTENEPDIENMFKAYMKQVTIQSKCVFDRSTRIRNKHEELPLNAQNMESIACDDSCIENLLNKEEYNKINFSNIEFLFTDEKLYNAVKSLTKKQKKLLYLIYIAEISEQEIAINLHITRQAVNKIKNAALKKIKKKYFKNF